MMLKTITLFVLVIALTSSTPIFKKESNKGISLNKNTQCGESIGEVSRPPNQPQPPVNPPVETLAAEAEQRIEEAGGFAGESYLRVSLTWDNCNDLDLWLEEPLGGTPEGEKVFYGNKNSAAGASLDVDANGGGCRTQSPVENIVYRARDGSNELLNPPLNGEYKVTVHYYKQHAGEGNETSTYTLLIKLLGRTYAFDPATLSERNEKAEFYFTFIDDKGCLGQGCTPEAI